MMAGVRQRGLFPFPVPLVKELDGKVKSLPRAVVRRIEEKHHVDEWVRDIVISLNSMIGGDDQGSFGDPLRPTLSQKISLGTLRQAVLDAGKPPDGITVEGALGKLRTNSGYTCGPVHLAPMNVDLVSLPPKGSVAAPLSLVFEEEAENVLCRLMSKVSAEEVIAGRKANCGMDPLLRQNPRGYAAFCRRLSEAGLIEHKEGFVGEVGAFAVWKKSGKQRLVIDARLANMHFETPDKVQLTTGSTFAS